MHLSKLFHSTTGRYVMSILLGLGLASLFRTVCKNKNCLVFHAPHLDEIENKIFKHDNKCYTYKTETVTCNSNKQVVPM